jgi:outer membrane protein TolC
MIKKILFLLLIIASTKINGQILQLETFIAQVKKNHPIAKQANQLLKMADANTLTANGAFDPVVGINSSQKKLDGVQYYNYTNPEIKYTTPIGINVKAGVENVGGDFANSELTKGQSSYAGVELQLLKGLLIDKNRATLKKAKIMQQQSIQENNAMLNDLLMEAYNSYWQWSGQYQLFTIYDGYVLNATQRLALVKLAYVQGDRAQADTVEAKTQLQFFEMQRTEALLQLQNASFEVSQYIWNEEGQGGVIASNTLPDMVAFEKIINNETKQNILESDPNNNPLLKIYDFKLQQLEVDKKLKNQNRLPTLNLQANTLSKYYFGTVNNNMFALQNNNKYGIQFKVPLLLRESRGEYQQALLKIKETKWQQDNKSWQLQNKLKQYTITSNLLNTQLQQTKDMIANYRFLVSNENLKFAQGETTIFLINSREIKLLEAQQKEIELKIKYAKAYIGVLWVSGKLQ